MKTVSSFTVMLILMVGFTLPTFEAWGKKGDKYVTAGQGHSRYRSDACYAANRLAKEGRHSFDRKIDDSGCKCDKEKHDNGDVTWHCEVKHTYVED